MFFQHSICASTRSKFHMHAIVHPLFMRKSCMHAYLKLCKLKLFQTSLWYAIKMRDPFSVATALFKMKAPKASVHVVHGAMGWCIFVFDSKSKKDPLFS